LAKASPKSQTLQSHFYSPTSRRSPLGGVLMHESYRHLTQLFNGLLGLRQFKGSDIPPALLRFGGHIPLVQFDIFSAVILVHETFALTRKQHSWIRTQRALTAATPTVGVHWDQTRFSRMQPCAGVCCSSCYRCNKKTPLCNIAHILYLHTVTKAFLALHPPYSLPHYLYYIWNHHIWLQ